jgi:hypothetical protein
MAKLTAATRKKIPTKDFAVAGRKYPIENPSHARDALARSSGKPVAGEVRAAVKEKFPSIGQKAERSKRLDRWASGKRSKP